MKPDFTRAMDQIKARFSDPRVNLADIDIQLLRVDAIRLTGKVLDEDTLRTVMDLVKTVVPGKTVQADTVKVLRQPGAVWMNVTVNLMGLFTQPSWLAEMGTQATYGALLEILEEQGDWVFVRQTDGYLGWMYKPYLSEVSPAEPNYIVCRPFAALYEQPDINSALTGRLPEGVGVKVSEIFGNWLKVDGHPCDLPCRMQGGWVNHAYLMPLENVPMTIEGKRDTIIETAYALYGVPYLWGGTTANGIDCSGLAQLCYRMAGVTLPRDADMQRSAGKLVSGKPQAGDLIYFTEEGNRNRISHVGISLGDGQIIHSSRRRNGVGVDEIKADRHLREDFAGAFSYLHNLN